jgi:hypothetical protein
LHSYRTWTGTVKFGKDNALELSKHELTFFYLQGEGASQQNRTEVGRRILPLTIGKTGVVVFVGGSVSDKMTKK